MKGASSLSLLRGLDSLRRSLLEPEYPLVAVEVRPRGLGVVRLERQGGGLRLAAAASVELPPGLLDLSVTRPNLPDPDAFTSTLSGLLERAGALRPGPMALVLPDLVARITVLPVAELTVRRGGDLLEMVRFRLRKTVPFEIRDAQVAVALPPRGGQGAVVAAIFRPVLEGYEAALVRLGLLPGLVEVSSLAILSLVQGSDGDRLLVNWDEGYASLVLTRDGWPLLVRTLAEAAAEPEGLRREVANTLLYHRERLGGAGLIAATVRTTVVPEADAVALLREPLGLPPTVLDPWAGLSAGDPPAGQALAGALGAVRRAVSGRAA